MRRCELTITFLLGLLATCLFVPAMGQPQASRWYFGRGAGIQFRAGQATQAVIDGSPLYNAAEGGATICNDQGNLLFYTDGTQIYNRLHVPMVGTRLLGGHTSSSQSALIVKQPGSATRYYVFTTDAIETYGPAHKGFRYTVLDMTLGGGLGGVVPGTFSTPVQTQTTEKLTAVNHANGTDVWVLTHGMGNNTFSAYRLTAAGLQLPAVTSSVGTPHLAAGAGNYNPGRGCMKFSPAGSKVAVAVLPNVTERWLLELFDFNNQTGAVSNPVDLSLPAGTDNGYAMYGVEFSPSGGKLYASFRKPLYKLYQYDLNQSNPAATRAEVATLVQEPGTLQLGPDGRIYVAKNSATALGVITQPEAVGAACTYQDNGLPLTGRTSTFGLNNLNQSLFYKIRPDFASVSACAGAQAIFNGTVLDYSGPTVGIVFKWNFGDPASGLLNRQTGTSVSHAFSRGGTFRVVLTINLPGGYVDSAFKMITIWPKPQVAFQALDSGWCSGEHQVRLVLPADAGQQVSLFPIINSAIISNAAGVIKAKANGQGLATIGGRLTSSQGCAGDSAMHTWQVREQARPMPEGPQNLCLLEGAVSGSYRLPAGTGNGRWLVNGDTLPPAAERVVSFTAIGRQRILVLGGINPATKTCYTPGTTLEVQVNEQKPLIVSAWDSAWCQDAPQGFYAVANALPDSAIRWRVEGGELLTNGAEARVNWAEALQNRITVTAATAPACPAQTLTATVPNRCLEVMNLITDNGDAQNASFTVRNVELYPDNELALYSRQGRPVFTAKSYRNQYKPEGVATGTYFYHFKVKKGGNYQVYKGWVDIVR